MADINVHDLDPALSFGSRVTGVTRDALQDEAVRADLGEKAFDRVAHASLRSAPASSQLGFASSPVTREASVTTRSSSAR